jgi:hypothetical protein
MLPLVMEFPRGSISSDWPCDRVLKLRDMNIQKSGMPNRRLKNLIAIRITIHTKKKDPFAITRSILYCICDIK